MVLEPFQLICAGVWIAAAVVLFIVEAATVSMVSIWFALSALVAAVLAAIDLPLWFQALVFVACAALLLVVTKPLVRRFQSGKVEHTNADRVVGQIAVVTQEIDNIQDKGQAKVAGQVWTARSVDGSVLAEGTLVEVVEIAGVKLMVRRQEPSA